MYSLFCHPVVGMVLLQSLKLGILLFSYGAAILLFFKLVTKSERQFLFIGSQPVGP